MDIPRVSVTTARFDDETWCNAEFIRYHRSWHGELCRIR
jgi:hypothetical protein